jgi:hypothetical protein
MTSVRLTWNFSKREAMKSAGQTSLPPFLPSFSYLLKKYEAGGCVAALRNTVEFPFLSLSFLKEGKKGKRRKPAGQPANFRNSGRRV